MSCELSVSTDAITANTATLRGGQYLIAVVKADGFGLGSTTVATAALAGGATMLAGATVAEARSLAGHGAPVLCWLTEPDELREPLPEVIEPAIPSLEHLAALPEVGRPRRVHLFIDTGMSRDGCPPSEWAALCRAARAAQERGTLRVVGLMGHLGCADPADLDHHLARRRFRRALAGARSLGLRPERVHLAATQACLEGAGGEYDTVRVGAGLAGIDPAGRHRLTPVARLTAPILQVRRVRAGALVGYGNGTRTERPGYLGLLPLGYADGLPRTASHRAEVLVDGERRRLLGTFSMDQVVVDLGDRPVAPGSVAVVFGPGDQGEPTLSEWAAWADTIEHEMLTGIGARVTRRAVASFESVRCAA